MASIALPAGRTLRLTPSALFDTAASLFTPNEGWLTVALVLAMNMTVAVFVQSAGWVEPMPRLWLVCAAAFVLALGVAKLPGPWFLQVPAHLVGMGLGAGLAIWEAAGTLANGSLDTRFGEIISRTREWVGAVGSSDISNDRLPFTVMLLALVFVMTYWSAWFAFKPRWAWASLLIPALGLLENQTYLPDSRYPLPLAFFLLFAIMVLARFHFLTRLRQWRLAGLNPRADRYAFLVNGVALAVLVLGLGWAIPTHRVVLPKLASTYQEARQPWSDLEGEWERVFAGIPSQKAAPLHSFGEAMPLRGAISLGSTPIFSVTTDYPAYWKAQTYDLYLGQGWIARPDQRAPAKATKASTGAVATQYRKRDAVALKVAMQLPTDVLFSPGQPLDVTVETNADAAAPRAYDINLASSRQAADLPADLARAADRLRAARGDRAALERALPTQTRIVRESGDILTVTRNTPSAPDILALRSATRLKAGATYEVLSSVSIATVVDLRADTTNYPKWVTDNYLQLPNNLPQRVRDLGQQLAANNNNTFDKAVAVAEYLKTGYRETYGIDSPPVNVDAVDYFLFTSKAGYSDYFASAMTILLRSAGVPARLAVGYGPGLFDEQSSTFTVRIGDAHSWPEVFFPSYGWITFEAAPSYAPIERGPRLEGGSTPGSGLAQGPLISDFDLDQLLLEEMLGQQPDVIRPSTNSPVGHIFLGILRGLGIALGVVAGLLALAFLAIYLVWQLNFVGLSYVEGAYERMARLGTLAWRAPREGQTPGDYARALASQAALQPAETGRIAGAYMKSKYGARQLSAEERAALAASWRSVRGGLLNRVLIRINPLRLFKR